MFLQRYRVCFPTNPLKFDYRIKSIQYTLQTAIDRPLFIFVLPVLFQLSFLLIHI